VRALGVLRDAVGNADFNAALDEILTPAGGDPYVRCVYLDDLFAPPVLRSPHHCVEILDRIQKIMVGRDGIEPPTPGFSVLFPGLRKCA
jgi:hypothetical protein